MNASDTQMKVQCKVHFRPTRQGRKRLVVGEAPAVAEVPEGRVPKVARLLALAIRMQGLVEQRAVTDYAQLARLGHITRARMTQIMNLTLLAPDLQEQILFLPPTLKGRDLIAEHDLRPIAAEFEWAKQRRMWGQLQSRLPEAIG